MTKRLLEYLTWLIIGANLLVSAYLGGTYYFQVFSIQEGFTTALAHSQKKTTIKLSPLCRAAAYYSLSQINIFL